MATHVARKVSMYRAGVVLKTKTDISIECGMGYNSEITITYQTPSLLYFMTSFQYKRQ